MDQTKKFYPNEVVQTKFYDILPLRNIRGHCYVIDKKSYCEGRPKDYTGEKDLYICEYELDKLFRELRRITHRRFVVLLFSQYRQALLLKLPNLAVLLLWDDPHGFPY